MGAGREPSEYEDLLYVLGSGRGRWEEPSGGGSRGHADPDAGGTQESGRGDSEGTEIGVSNNI